MSSTSESIREIRKVLISGEDVDLESLKQLATVHAEATALVMEKAFFCTKLLHDDKRAEAVALARRAPDLRDEFSLVDFDELTQWQVLCDKQGLPVTHMVTRNMVHNVIDELYSENPAFEKLLKKHRVLALSHAPMKDRLENLCLLAWEDPNPDFWKEDIALYEKGRLDEIRKGVRVSGNAGDLKALDDLIGEIESHSWQQESVDKLLVTIKKIAAPFRQKYAREQYQGLVEGIRQTHAAMDVNLSASLLSQWNAIADQTGTLPSEELRMEVAPVQQWLLELKNAAQNERAFEQACAALEEALDDNEGDQVVLDNMAAAILSFEQGMPELLAARYQSRLEEVQRDAKRHFYLKLTAVAGVLILLAIGATLLLQHRGRQQDILQWKNTITDKLAEKDIEAIGKLFEKAKDISYVVAAPDIQALKSDYEYLCWEEESRRDQYEKLIRSFELGGVSSLTDENMKKAQELAKTQEERGQVESYRQKYLTKMDEQRQKRDMVIRDQVDELEKMFSVLQKADIHNWGIIKSESGECLKLAKDLLAIKDASLVYKQRILGIQKSVNEISEEAQSLQKQGEDLKKLPSLYAQPAVLGKALGNFSQNYPEHLYSVQFVKSAALAEQWQAVASWHKIAVDLNGKICIHDEQTASNRLRQVDAYLKTQQGGPQHKSISLYRDYLKKAADILADNKLKHLSSTKGIIDNPLVADTKMLSTTDGQVFYLMGNMLTKKRLGDSGQKFKYYSDGAGTIKDHEIKNQLIDKTSLLQASPQSVFAHKIRENIRKYDLRDWEVFYLGLAETALQSTKMDPVFKANILKILLSYSSDCCPFKIRPIAQSKDMLDDLILDVAWMDPLNEEARLSRGPASRVIIDVASGIKEAQKEIERNMKEMIAGITPYRPIGILLGKSNEIMLPIAIEKGDAYILWKDDDKNIVFKKVGIINKNTIRVTSSERKLYPEGSMLFTPIPWKAEADRPKTASTSTGNGVEL